MSAVNTKIPITGIVQTVVLSIVLGLLLFIAAGTVFWFYGWIFLILLFSSGIAIFMACGV